MSELSSNSMPPLVVLAGGLGTRLRSVVMNQPKILAPIGKHPYLFHLIRWAERQGITHMHFCLGYLAEKVIVWLQSVESPIRFSWQVETQQLGTGGAIKLALSQPELRACDALLICNGDTFVDFSVEQFVNLSNITKAGILTVRVPDSGRFGTLQHNTQGYLVKFLEKQGMPVPGVINAGWYYFGQEILEELKKREVVSLERDFLMKPDLPPIRCIDIGRQFLDFGTPESYQTAQSWFKDTE